MMRKLKKTVKEIIVYLQIQCEMPTVRVERRKTSLCSLIDASWMLVMCPHGTAKLTAALPSEQNDIVCTLPLSLLLFQYRLAPPPFLCTFAGSINCTAQQCSPSAAADPA